MKINTKTLAWITLFVAIACLAIQILPKTMGEDGKLRTFGSSEKEDAPVVDLGDKAA